MSRVMTKKEKMAYIQETKKILAGAPTDFIAGFDHQKGTDFMAYRDNPYTREDGDKGRHWAAGFERATITNRVREELKNTVPVTFGEILALPRKDMESWDTSRICSLIEHHMIQGVYNATSVWVEDKAFERIDVETIFYDNGDGERTRTIGLLSFDSIPVMLYNHSGRGSFEYSNEFVLNSLVFKNMALYIQSVLLEHDDDADIVEYSPDDDAEHLINFYGSRLEIVKGEENV
ncbi:hypothetical protein KASHIRA_02440 [Serratia phage vB_SmaM-Kashira]|nr:hypothetical protein [Acinetobacter phage ABPH49]URC22818.1 hypothetical protein KASHIRA_02440 [Serratia phage vB_SmaM-Kashira]